MRSGLRFVTLGLLALLALFAGCTGTSEPRPPTLLIVGAAPGGQPSLLLVEDVSSTAPRGEPRLEVLAAGSRPLLAPAVALDFEDRAGDRGAAWVLVRETAEVNGSLAVTAHLQRFLVEDVVPDAPDAFSEDAAARVTLTEPGGSGVLDGLSLTSPVTCPTALQVDSAGTVAVVLDDPPSCGSGDHPELWLVPLDGDPPQALQGTNDVAPLPAYLDQRPDQQVVYFLVDAINTTHVYSYDLTDPPSERLVDKDVPEPASELTSATGAGDLLVVLGEEDLLTVDLVESAAAERADTRVGAVAIAADPTGLAPEVLVLAPGAIAFHSTPLDATPDTTARTAFAGTVDPVTRFGYAVGEGTLTILDLLTGGDTDHAFRPYSEPLSELELPDALSGSVPGADATPVTVIGWVRAAAPVAP